jgi:ribosome-associated protein
MTGIEISLFAARSASEKKGEDIVIYDLRGISDVSDYFVVVTAQSKLQVRAIVSGIERGLKDLSVRPLGVEGSSGGQWVLIDYADTVIHVFSPALREYYALEALWGDAPKIDWEAAGSGQRAAAT